MLPRGLCCAHGWDSYWPFTLVIRPSNSSAAPGAAVVSVMAGMGSDRAQGSRGRGDGREAEEDWQGCCRAERRGWLWSMSQSALQHLGLERQLDEMGRVTPSGLKMRGMDRTAFVDVHGGVQSMVCSLHEHSHDFFCRGRFKLFTKIGKKSLPVLTPPPS